MTRATMRRNRLVAQLVLAISLVASGAGCDSEPTRVGPPNIVLIVIDTLRADHLESYGYPHETAPTLRRLAQRGVLFERVIASSSWTKTSMASMMTAQNPSRHGVLRHPDVMPRELTTLAKSLAASGYETLGVNTNPWLRPQFGFGVGYRVYDTLRKSGATSAGVNARALSLARERQPDVPVFLYLHYMDVHGPYQAEPEFVGGEPIALNGEPISDVALDERYRKEDLVGAGVRERVIALYDGGIRDVDAAIDELLEGMRPFIDFDNTIVVVTADHGEAFREHGTTEHGWNLYPEVVEVPLIFVWPEKLGKDVRIGAQVRSIDIAPTLLALAGVPAPATFAGLPLLPMEPGAIDSRIAHSEVRFRRPRPPYHYAAVISPDRLYQREKYTDKVEFYDLKADPGATRDLGRDDPRALEFAALEVSVPTPELKQTEIDDETRSELKALGYLQ